MTHFRIGRLLLLSALAGVTTGCGGGSGASADAREAWIEGHRQRLLAGGDSLSLYSTINTNILLSRLAGMEEVETINLDQTLDLSEEGLSQLKTYPNLHTLSFWGEPIVDDAALHHIAECKGLTSLHLVYQMKSHGVTKEGVRRLQQALPDCKISIVRH